MLTFHPRNEGAAGAPAADTVWADLLNPTESEIQLIEDHTGLRIPKLEDLREIERSSQLSAEGQVLRLATPVLAEDDTDHPSLTYIGLILTPKLLVTVRFAELKIFAAIPDRACPAGSPSCSVEVFAALLEAFVDRQADLLERAREHLDGVSRTAFRDPGKTPQRQKRSNEALRKRLRTLGRIGERVSMIRDSLLAVGRIAPFAQETGKAWITQEYQSRLSVVRQDIESLNQFEEHLTNKVQFLLDAILGFISIDQNDIFKVLTIASVVGIPPTLVASMYGMNFHNIPEYEWAFGYQWGLLLIVMTTLIPLALFKWRGWL
ncbi:MAG TPA: magnesium transporter CorA family protein [Caulobacteraceae bacterium]|jgi:magnesium transporter|nr:magnesium transporter CorA family protein [Caulobacteraceae bacterium]